MAKTTGKAKAKKPRNILSVEISPKARESLDEAVEVLRMKKKDVVASLLHWFVAEPEETRQLIMGTLAKRFVPLVQRELIERLGEAGNNESQPAEEEEGVFDTDVGSSQPLGRREGAPATLDKQPEEPPPSSGEGKPEGRSK